MSQEIIQRINNIVESPSTIKTTIIDYPDVHKYLSKKFPKVDLSNVPIYIVESDVMDQEGFESAGGLYIQSLQVILVRSKIEIASGTDSKFEKALDKAIKAEANRQDVIVHELLHCISHKTRVGNQYRNGEEEFVYTNCVEFYVEQGRSEHQIVNTTFLPFCINDVLSDKVKMSEVFKEMRQHQVDLPDMARVSIERYKSIMDQNANLAVDIIVRKAREIAAKMMFLYNEYGSKMVHSNTNPTNDTSLRIRSLEFDDDDW